MTPSEFACLRERFNDECWALLYEKGQDYSPGDDQLASFKRMAERLGLTPMQVWAVFFLKHLEAILSFARSGKVHSEPIRGRFMDARNYLDLGYALAVESAEKENP